MNPKTKHQIRLGLKWLCIISVWYFTIRMIKDYYENDMTYSKFLVGLIFFGWGALMLKDGR